MSEEFDKYFSLIMMRLFKTMLLKHFIRIILTVMQQIGLK